MMSLEAIHNASAKAARRAARQRLQPYVPFNTDEIDRYPGGVAADGSGFPFPHLGTYVPKGWEEVDRLFVDSSGYGSADEPALTIDAFNRIVKTLVSFEPGTGFAVVEVGQFQVYVGVFRRTTHSLCRKVMS